MGPSWTQLDPGDMFDLFDLFWPNLINGDHPAIDKANFKKAHLEIFWPILTIFGPTTSLIITYDDLCCTTYTLTVMILTPYCVAKGILNTLISKSIRTMIQNESYKVHISCIKTYTMFHSSIWIPYNKTFYQTIV